MRNFYALILFVFLSISCSDDNDVNIVEQEGLSTAPDAKIEFNDNNYGMYKGILVGVTGNISVNIYNDENLNATLVMNGHTMNFTTTETVVMNESIVGLTFTNGDSSFDFNVDATGETPFISNLELADLPFANVEILKEYSDAHVKCYEGTYSNAAGVVGVFNITTIADSLYGLSKAYSDPDSYFLEAVMINHNTFQGSFQDGTFSGLVSGIAIGGDWQNGFGYGTWNGQRKL